MLSPSLRAVAACLFVSLAAFSSVTAQVEIAQVDLTTLQPSIAPVPTVIPAVPTAIPPLQQTPLPASEPGPSPSDVPTPTPSGPAGGDGSPPVEGDVAATDTSRAPETLGAAIPSIDMLEDLAARPELGDPPLAPDNARTEAGIRAGFPQNCDLSVLPAPLIAQYGHWALRSAPRPWEGSQPSDLDAGQQEVIRNWELNPCYLVWVFDVAAGPENNWAGWGPPPPGWSTRPVSGILEGDDLPWPPPGTPPTE